MRKLSEQVGTLLTPFQNALGNDFAKTVRDMSSFLGSQSITTEEGAVKAGSKLSVSFRDSHKMSLPPNNPLSHLYWFSLRINEVAQAGKMEMQCSLPEIYKNWLEQNRTINKIAPESAPVSK